jgi:hypothetical protein
MPMAEGRAHPAWTLGLSWPERVRGGEMRIQGVTPQQATRVFAMARDEGGVGETSVVANLALALTKLQKNCLSHGYRLWSGKSQDSSKVDPAISRGGDSVSEVASGRPAVVGSCWTSRTPLWRSPSSRTRTASSATTGNRRRHTSQCPNQPGVPPMSHGDLCIATTTSPSGQMQFFWQRLFR